VHVAHYSLPLCRLKRLRILGQICVPTVTGDPNKVGLANVNLRKGVMPSEGKWQFFAGLFLICMCGLMLQIIETRILSVIAYYYLAFFAIGMAMFGMTAGSLFVYFRESFFPRERLFENLVWICAIFAIAVVISALLTISIVITSVSKDFDFLMTALEWGELVAILAAPYFLLGWQFHWR